LESIRKKVNFAMFQGTIPSLVLRARVKGEKFGQDTILKLRPGNHKPRNMNINFSIGSLAVVFNAKWLLQRQAVGGWGGEEIWWLCDKMGSIS
jgi:hypothetical protein